MKTRRVRSLKNPEHFQADFPKPLNSLPAVLLMTLITLTALYFLSPLHAALPDQNISSLSEDPYIFDQAIFNANQLYSDLINNGQTVTHIIDGDAGMHWPGKSGPGVFFAQGLWILGKDQAGQVRSAASEFTTEWSVGPLGTAHSTPRIYSIGDGVDTPDWNVWPSEDGAPVNHLGQPRLFGSQTHWWVMNDSDVTKHSWLWATEPIGVEMQYTVFGIDSVPGLENTMFVKALLIHKGREPLTDTYIGIWSDFDLGSATDDKGATDTQRLMHYLYNGHAEDAEFGSRVPAVASAWLQGPLVPSSGDTARLCGRSVPDFRNLNELSSSVFFNAYNRNPSDPETAHEAWLYMSGMGNDSNPLVDPWSGETTPYHLSGDPLTGTGSLADRAGDLRALMSMGPFDFSAGDSQEVIFAVFTGMGTDSVNAVLSLRETLPWLQAAARNDFQTMRLPVNIGHDVNMYDEGADQVTLACRALPGPAAEGQLADLSAYTAKVWYMLDEAEALYWAELAPASMNPAGWTQYLATIPNDGLQHRIRYWFEFAGQSDTWRYPIAAPQTHFESLIGPDSEAPELHDVFKTPDIQSMFNPGTAPARGRLIYTDRFPPSDFLLQTAEKGAEWTDLNRPHTLIVDTLYEYSALRKSYEISWQGDLAWNLDLDTLEDEKPVGKAFLRFAARDASAASNLGAADSSLLTVNFGSDMRIDAVPDSNPMTWPESFSSDWVLNGWIYERRDLSFSTYVMQADSVFSYRENLNTTATCLRPFPVSQFRDSESPIGDQLSVQAICTTYINEGDTGFIEVSADLKDWMVAESFTSLRVNYFAATADLSQFINNDSLYIRFRFKSDAVSGSQNYGWLIGSVYLYGPNAYIKIDGLQDADAPAVPDEFTLYANYPNPFNAVTTLRFSLPETGTVKVRIYSLKGSLVRSWESAPLSSGMHSLHWNGRDDRGRELPSGLYLLQMENGYTLKSRKCLLLK